MTGVIGTLKRIIPGQKLLEEIERIKNGDNCAEEELHELEQAMAEEQAREESMEILAKEIKVLRREVKQLQRTVRQLFKEK